MSMHLLVLDSSHAQRPAVEDAIRTVFAAEYGARLPSLPPTLAALRDEKGAILSATGLRYGVDGFFSEQYLDHPVEEILSRFSGLPVLREQVVEIGSMAGFRPATSLHLVDLVARRCLDQGVTWAVFTATARLRALLRRSRIHCFDLAPAMPDKVADPTSWGRYYLHDPRVVAVHGALLPRFMGLGKEAAEATHA
jgi:hypothetical protein